MPEDKKQPKKSDAIGELLNKIQQKLVVPKTRENTFGGYMYRSCEDILEAVKPFLGEAVLLISDEVVLIGERYYVKATVTLGLGKENQSIVVSALARETEARKKMDDAQLTGAASSYARKYALNGLFCIDDTKDPDATNKHETEKNNTISIRAEIQNILTKKWKDGKATQQEKVAALRVAFDTLTWAQISKLPAEELEKGLAVIQKTTSVKPAKKETPPPTSDLLEEALKAYLETNAKIVPQGQHIDEIKWMGKARENKLPLNSEVDIKEFNAGISVIYVLSPNSKKAE